MSEPATRVGAGETAPSVRILGADDTAAIDQVRQFFRNYAAWLGVDLCFQNFDEEMATLPGRYAAPQGRLFYAEVDGQGQADRTGSGDDDGVGRGLDCGSHVVVPSGRI